MSRDSARGMSALLLLAALVGGCGERVPAEPFAVGFHPGPLRPLPAPLPAGSIRDYVVYYELDFSGVRHSFGTLRLSGHDIATHLFEPPEPRATVVLVHGYLDHVGVLKPLIGALLAENFAVAAYDQVGHGLSSGEPTAISDFEEYSSVLASFVGVVSERLPAPVHLVAHSMGGAVVLDLLTAAPETPVESVALMAPLVRPTAWPMIRALGLHRVAESIPRYFPANSGDEDYLAFRRNDPLQPEAVALGWARALEAWHDRMEERAPVERPALLLQGRRDGVVDWEYNLPYFERYLVGSEILFFDEGRHQLVNESEMLRAEVFDAIVRYLGRQPPSEGESTVTAEPGAL